MFDYNSIKYFEITQLIFNELFTIKSTNDK